MEKDTKETKPTQRVWFTSDIHFSHANIIRFCNRPFVTVEEMDETIISNWNSVVGQHDYVYIVGDVFFHNATNALKIAKRLNGIKVLIYGNHDKVIRNNKELRDQFSETHELLERRFVSGDTKVTITMCHFAMKVWNKSHHGALHLYGHSHGSMPDDGTRSMDVGMDAVGFYPISLEEVINRIGSRPLVALDHHTNEGL